MTQNSPSNGRKGTVEALTPIPKVVASGAGGAASVALVWLLGQFGVSMPAEVAAAFTTLLAFAAGYLKK